MSFPKQVNTLQAPATWGDFCDANVRITLDAGQGGLVAGPGNVTVGRFAWVTPPNDSDGAPAQVNSFGEGPVAGFVHRGQQGLITAYLGTAAMIVQAGFPMALFTTGGFWVQNEGAATATVGMKAYATLSSGAATFAATGSQTAGGSGTGAITQGTSSATGSINGNIATVTAVGSGTLVAGTTWSGTGVVAGTQIVSQITPLLAGEALGGVGRYLVNYTQSVVSTTLSGTYGILTTSGSITGAFAVGQLLSGTDVVAGTAITQLGTGTGGDGTYFLNNNTAVGSTTITGEANVETSWFAVSEGAPGELVKISNHQRG